MICDYCGKEPVTVLDFEVDACISDIVTALNAGGAKTLACCCGHGRETSRIVLADGRELQVFPFDRDRASGQWSSLVSLGDINTLNRLT